MTVKCSRGQGGQVGVHAVPLTGMSHFHTTSVRWTAACHYIYLAGPVLLTQFPLANGDTVIAMVKVSMMVMVIMITMVDACTEY